jgi:hypothetical protein
LNCIKMIKVIIDLDDDQYSNFLKFRKTCSGILFLPILNSIISPNT